MKYSNLLKSSLGTFAARVAMSISVFLGTFVIASMAGASVLGMYSLFIAVVTLIELFTDMGIDEASKKRMSEGRNQGELFTAALTARLTIFVIVAVGILTFETQILSYIGSEEALPFLFLVPLTIVLYRTVESGLYGERKVARAGFLEVVFSTGRLVIWVALLLIGYGLFGILVGVGIGYVLAALIGLTMLSIRPAIPSVAEFKSLYEFAKYSWAGSIRETSWLWTDTLVLGLFVAPAFVGIYELSWQISGVLFFVASAISSTLFPNISSLAARGEYAEIRMILEEALVYTGILAIPGLVGGIIFAEQLLGVFGEEFVLGSLVLGVLILARVFHSYEVVFGKVINALDRPDLMFRVDTIFVALNVVLNVIAISVVGWIGAAFATVGAMVLRTMLTYRYLSMTLSFSFPTRDIALEVIAALVMGMVLWPFATADVSVLDLILLVGLGACIYLVVVLVLVRRVRSRTFDLADTVLTIIDQRT